MEYKKVLLVAERDTITGRLKSGPYLRLKFGVEGYKYIIKEDLLSQSKYIRNLSFNVMTNLYMLIKVLLQRAMFVDGDFDFVHSFFWTFYKYKKPWIHENDQSPSQLIYNYMKIKNGFGQYVAEKVASIINGSEAVITWTNYAKEGFIKDGVDKHKIFVVPLPSEIKCNKKAHEGFNILFVGRDFYRKGGDIAIAIYKRLVEKHKNVRLIYVGKAYVKDEGIVHYEGLPRPVLESLYEISDLMVYPSRDEAYGLAALEALSHGVPVISSSLPSLKEIVSNGEDGYTATDTDEFVEKVEELINSPNKLEVFSKNACKKVKEKHDPKKISERMKEIYEKAI